MFGHSPSGEVAVHFDLVTPRLQQAQDSASLTPDTGLGLLRLVGDDHAQARQGLAGHGGEGGGEGGRPSVGGDQNVHSHRVRATQARPGVRATQARPGVRATQAGPVIAGPPPLARRRPGCAR